METATELQKTFPAFSIDLIEELVRQSKYKSFEINEEIIRLGETVFSVPLIVSGLVRVFRQDEQGQEMLLYFLKSGEFCSTTLSCCTEKTYSKITAIAEEKTLALLIPINSIDTWILKYPEWKKFIMQSFRMRFDELLQTIDSIAFMKMDERLENYFKNLYQSKKIKTYYGTHQEIASHLNTSREVISRLLKQLEKKQKVILARNKIDFSQLCD